MFCFHHLQVFTRCRFQNVSVRVPFSKSTVFKICRQKMCRFRVNGRPIRRIFHHFQNVPASCERSLKLAYKVYHIKSLITQFYPTLQKGAFNVLEGMVLKFFWEHTPDPIFHSLHLPVHPTFWGLAPPLLLVTLFRVKGRRKRQSCGGNDDQDGNEQDATKTAKSVRFSNLLLLSN